MIVLNNNNTKEDDKKAFMHIKLEQPYYSSEDQILGQIYLNLIIDYDKKIMVSKFKGNEYLHWLDKKYIKNNFPTLPLPTLNKVNIFKISVIFILCNFGFINSQINSSKTIIIFFDFKLPSQILNHIFKERNTLKIFLSI